MIMDIEEIKTKILENKKEHYGKRIGNRTFGGAGEKTVKLCGTVPEDDIYVPYTDIANQRDLDAKNIYAYFFENKDIETVEYSEDFEDEEEKLEEIMGG